MSNASTQPLAPLPANDDILIPSRQLPAYVGLSIQTLARWRHEGKGPEYVKIGRMVAYRVKAVRSWLGSGERKSTSI